MFKLTLTKSKVQKFLGIHIDQQLKCDVHVDSIMQSKISSSLFIMNKVKHFIPKFYITLWYIPT